MRVFVAGASGAIGRPLVPKLVAAGHEVTGTTRNERSTEAIRAAGAQAAICDALDPAAVEDAVTAAAPEAIVSELTSLPKDYDLRKIDYEPTNRLRVEGGGNLISAGRKVGAQRYITQSIAFVYEPEGDWVKDEEARTFVDAPGRFASGLEATLTSEREALDAEGMDGLVLRYGQFYGPGTYFDRDGSIAEQVRARRFPQVGKGTGVFSFVHVDDAADATLAAVERGAPGIYNVVDDDPAPISDWLPVFADAIGAKRPMRVPTFLARLVGGKAAVVMATQLRGASNAKAKRELGWQPAHPSWRQGFAASLG
ncbi:MAG TPA: NAD(P)-dependent oxidoreductase [Solirubrobacterales bacterium]|jgi:nucleoside-diphosphate-sugar epimerase